VINSKTAKPLGLTIPDMRRRRICLRPIPALQCPPVVPDSQILRAVLSVIDQVCPDGSPEEILNGIEQDLRARYATQIEVNGSKAVAITVHAHVKSESDQKVDGNG
jgi:hypothetical protein